MSEVKGALVVDGDAGVDSDPEVIALLAGSLESQLESLFEEEDQFVLRLVGQSQAFLRTGLSVFFARNVEVEAVRWTWYHFENEYDDNTYSSGDRCDDPTIKVPVAWFANEVFDDDLDDEFVDPSWLGAAELQLDAVPKMQAAAGDLHTFVARVLYRWMDQLPDATFPFDHTITVTRDGEILREEYLYQGM